jgi:pilus assembly protein Flp/PilA
MGELPLEGLEAMPRFARLIRDQKGATAVEYSLICALIVLAMIAGLSAFASSTINMWSNVSASVVSHSG